MTGAKAILRPESPRIRRRANCKQPHQGVINPMVHSTIDVRNVVAMTSLALAILAVPAFGSGQSAPASKSETPASAAVPDRHSSAPVRQPAATAPRKAMPPERPASTAKEMADARAKTLQRLRIESCRRRPETCVQPQSDDHAASAPAIAR